jgi:lipopolysaccharide transport system permease protein
MSTELPILHPPAQQPHSETSSAESGDLGTRAEQNEPAETIARRAQAAAELAAQPLRVITARGSWQLVDLHEAWHFRELLYFLTWRDIAVRYKQSLLGAGWAILQPASQMLIFTFVFGRMAKVSSDGLPYPLFVLAGLLPWMFFSNAISLAASSIVSNQNLITKVYFPRWFIPASCVGVALIDFLIGLGLLALFVAGYAVAGVALPFSPAILLVPLLIFLLAVGGLGVGLLISALSVAYRDFKYIVPFLVQLWMFATPVIYMSAETDAVAPQWRWLLALNPAMGLIQTFRGCVLGTPIDLIPLALSSGVALLFLWVGASYFQHVEKRMADII